MSLVGVYGGFYFGDKKKKKKEYKELQATRVVRVYTPPKIEIIGKRKKGK